MMTHFLMQGSAHCFYTAEELKGCVYSILSQLMGTRTLLKSVHYQPFSCQRWKLFLNDISFVNEHRGRVNRLLSSLLLSVRLRLISSLVTSLMIWYEISSWKKNPYSFYTWTVAFGTGAHTAESPRNGGTNWISHGGSKSDYMRHVDVLSGCKHNTSTYQRGGNSDVTHPQGHIKWTCKLKIFTSSTGTPREYLLSLWICNVLCQLPQMPCKICKLQAVWQKWTFCKSMSL